MTDLKGGDHMDYRILALGDVASETGLQLLEKKLRTF